LTLIENDLGYVIGNEAELRALWENRTIRSRLAKTAAICRLVRLAPHRATGHAECAARSGVMCPSKRFRCQ